MGSCFRLSELNASYLEPQIKEIKNIIHYRSLLYKRYVKNFSKWLNSEFTICNKLVHKFKYNYHAFTIILKKNEREKFLKYLRKNNIIAFISFEALHLSKVGKRFLTKNTKLKNTEEIVKKITLMVSERIPSKYDFKLYFNKILGRNGGGMLGEGTRNSDL